MRAHKDHNILRYWKSILMNNETTIPLYRRYIENSCQFNLEMNIIYAYYCMNTFYCQEPTMKPNRDNTEKHKRLQQAGTLNTTPEKILDPMFSVAGDFFDAHDLLQVRYEMIRLVRIDDSAGAHRTRHPGRCRQTLRRVASHLLPDEQSVRQKWATGTDPGTERTQRPAQDHTADAGFRG